MAKMNGTWKFYIYIILLIAGIAGSYAVFGRDVIEMKPKVEANTEYRHKDEIEKPYIKEAVAEIKLEQKAMRKDMVEGFKGISKQISELH